MVRVYNPMAGHGEASKRVTVAVRVVHVRVDPNNMAGGWYLLSWVAVHV